MIGIDTNVLVRLLVADDPRQAAAAQRWVAGQTGPGGVRVCVVVLCELEWVLRSVYRYQRSEIAPLISSLLQSASFSVESPSLVARALEGYTASRADFSDLLIGELNRAAGATHTVTFDRAAANLPAFELLDVDA